MSETDDLPRLLVEEGASFEARGIIIGERINTRSLPRRLGTAPAMVEVGERGWAAVFRYGAVVTFNVTEAEQSEFLQELLPRVNDSYRERAVEGVEICIERAPGRLVAEGEIILRDASVERLQIVAEILGKSVVLDHYEERIAAAFAAIEPMARDLKKSGRGLTRARRLLQHIGETLTVQHMMVGRVEVSEKPELLWEHPELERIYVRLEDEYELRERHVALERKLELIARTSETMLELLQTRRSLRVEWYIVILIVIEILLMLYEMFIS